MVPVYYAVSIAAATLAVLRYGVVPVLTAARHGLNARRELVVTVHELVDAVGTLTGRVETLERKAA